MEEVATTNKSQTKRNIKTVKKKSLSSFWGAQTLNQGIESTNKPLFAIKLSQNIVQFLENDSGLSDEEIDILYQASNIIELRANSTYNASKVVD